MAGPFVLVGLEQGSAADTETPKEIVADQIRAQGYRCDDARSAERDTKDSRPDEAVWILTCENGSYRVRLKPDMAAIVEPLQ